MSWQGEDEKITTQAEGCDSTQNEGKTQMEEDRSICGARVKD